MQRIACASALSVLTVVIGVAIARAEAPKSAPETKAISMPAMSAFDLASLAYRGYFRDQGIPGYATLSEAHRAGRIRAKDIVSAAIKMNRVPEQALSDRSYLNAIDSNLSGLDPRR